ELRLEAAVHELCRDLKQPPWANTHLPELDRRSLATFIDESAQSERGQWWLRARSLSDEGDDPEKIGLLGWLCFNLLYLAREGGEMSAYRVAGGTREMISRMAQSIMAEPNLGHVL